MPEEIKTQKTKSRWGVYFGICALLIGVVAMGAIFKLETAEANRVPPGVYVQDLDMSNLEKQQAMERLKGLERSILTRKVVINCLDKSWSIPLEQLGLTVNVEDTLNQALENDGSKLLRRVKTYFHPVKKQIPLSIGVDRERLSTALEPIIHDVERPASDAKLNIAGDGKVIMIPDEKGRKVNVDQLYSDLISVDIETEEIKFNLQVDEFSASKTLEEIKAMKINGKIGEFTTFFDPENLNRTINIKTAAKKINSLILSPGQEFSFNKTVGPRTKQAGYRPATVIVANKFDEALGGGICQVSTTIYNAILLANLNPTERHNHSLAVSYVSMGRDAAVAWNILDFKFKNTLSGHVYLRTLVENDHITVQIYGDTAAKKDITVRSWVSETIKPDKVIKEVDPSLAPGEEILMEPGYMGFRAEAERIIKENGLVVKTESLPASYYRPRPKVFKVGPQSDKAQEEKNQAKNANENDNSIQTEY